MLTELLMKYKDQKPKEYGDEWQERTYPVSAVIVIAEKYAETKVKEISTNVPVSGSFSAEYLDFIKQAELPPLTNTQHYFAEWLIKNAEIITQIGDLEIIFVKVRRWLKNLH